MAEQGARSRKRAAPEKAAEATAAPPVVEAMAPEALMAAPGEASFETSYLNAPVMAFPVWVLVPAEVHTSKWYHGKHEGQRVAAVVLKPPVGQVLSGGAKSLTLFDGDGSATLRFVTHRGDPAFSCRGIEGAILGPREVTW